MRELLRDMIGLGYEVLQNDRRFYQQCVASRCWNRSTPRDKQVTASRENISKIPGMEAFHRAREAKEFLISKIVAEAERENAPLSELERKMLYFSESGWTLPEMTEVYEEFDRDYDQNDYERKIAKLIRKADKHVHEESREEYEAWWSAIRFLKRQDHYISVMVGIAGLRPAGGQLKLLGTGLAVATCLLMIGFFSAKYQVHLSRYLPRDALSFYIWIVGVCVVVVYSLVRFIMGRKKVDDLTSRALEKFARLYQRIR